MAPTSKGHHFDRAQRLLLCDHCGGPLPAPEAGGQVTCGYCRATTLLRPKAAPLRASDPEGAAPIPEEERMRLLREQDGERLQPPMTLPFRLLVWHGHNPMSRAGMAMEYWQTARQELTAATDPAAEATLDASARLYYLTLSLSNYHAKAQETDKLRSRLETAYELCVLKRERQVLLGLMARNAARFGEIDAAEAWLAEMDPRSADLYEDTSYRSTRAHVFTVRHQFPQVLESLGARFEDIPIADAFDHHVAVLRANAHERLGDVDAAARELEAALDNTPGTPRGYLEIVKNQPALDLAPQSIKRVVSKRMRFWRARYALYSLLWLGLPAFLFLQYALTEYPQAAWLAGLRELRVFNVPSIAPAIVVFLMLSFFRARLRP
jgi:hypothetical protein